MEKETENKEINELQIYYNELVNNTVNFDYQLNKYLYDNILQMLK